MQELSPIKTTLLTKKFLMELEEGLFLVSNTHNRHGSSIYAEVVSSVADREHQWKDIVAIHANQRLCHVFNTKEDYEVYFAQKRTRNKASGNKL